MLIRNVELVDGSNYLITGSLGSTGVQELGDGVGLVVLAKRLCDSIRDYGGCAKGDRVALKITSNPVDRDYRIDFHYPDRFFPDNADSYQYLCTMGREELVVYLQEEGYSAKGSSEDVVGNMVHVVADLNMHGLRPEVLEVVGENGKAAIACYDRGIAKREFGKVSWLEDYGSLWKVINKIVEVFKGYAKEEGLYLEDFDMVLELNRTDIDRYKWFMSYSFLSVDELFDGVYGYEMNEIGFFYEERLLGLSQGTEGDVGNSYKDRLAYWFGRLLKGYKFLGKEVKSIEICMSSAFELTYYIAD